MKESSDPYKLTAQTVLKFMAYF